MSEKSKFSRTSFLSTKHLTNKTFGKNPTSGSSDCVPLKGILRTSKIEYSKETADLLHSLMKESKMPMMMRKKINYHLSKGEPLPKPPESFDYNTKYSNPKASEVMRRARWIRRKSRDQILASATYDSSTHRICPVANEETKLQLEEVMAGMRLSDLYVRPKRKRRVKNDVHASESDLIDEMLEQIKERADWLADTEDIGDGNLFRDEVREQIAERMRKVKELKLKMEIKKRGMRYVE